MIAEVEPLFWDKVISGQVGFALAVILAGWVYCKIILPRHDATVNSLATRVGELAKSIDTLATIHKLHLFTIFNGDKEATKSAIEKATGL